MDCLLSSALDFLVDVVPSGGDLEERLDGRVAMVVCVVAKANRKSGLDVRCEKSESQKKSRKEGGMYLGYPNQTLYAQQLNITPNHDQTNQPK